MSNSRFFEVSSLVLFCLIGVLLTGCGTTTLSLKPESQVDFAQYRSLSIQTKTSDGVPLTETAQDRIKDFIKTEINSGCCPNRFDSIYTDTAHPDGLLLVLNFTKYDEGVRSARTMFAGRGAMKINAEVEVKDGKSAKTICEGDAGKSFSWGGLVGAATGIEDVEIMFAKVVSRGVGEMLVKKPKKKSNSPSADPASVKQTELTAMQINKQAVAEQSPVMTETPQVSANAALPDIKKIARAQQKAKIAEYEGKRSRLIENFKNAFTKIRCGPVAIDATGKNITYKRGPYSYTASKDGDIVRAKLTVSILSHDEEKVDTAFFKWFVKDISARAGIVYPGLFTAYTGANAAQCFLLQAQNDISEYVRLFYMSADLGEKDQSGTENSRQGN
ncbi:MAG: DUF4410 domain-containing protein [Nitrospirae bacterium]|nr:DUF4410 domain-containing protein [Nitrospirota bacterium]